MLSEQERKDALVESVHGLAKHLACRARTMDNCIFDLEDMIQAALLGAVSAAVDYIDSHESEASFSTFAIHRMRQEIYKLYRKSGIVNISKRDYSAMDKRTRVVTMFNFVHLSTPVTEDDSVSMGDILPAPIEGDDLFRLAAKKTLRHLVLKLPDPERDMIEKVYGFTGEPMSIADAAVSRGISRQRGWQLITAGLAKVERWCRKEGCGPHWL